MIIRVAIYTAVILALGALAYLFPPKPPKEPQNSRFVKITSEGDSIGVWKGPWKCVLDRDNGLLWEVKGYNQDIHSKECSFSWFDGKIGAKKRGNCYIEGGHSDSKDLIDYFNSHRVCGADNWRLPTIDELKTLLYRGVPPNKPLIRYDLFPRTQKAPYWSSNRAEVLRGFFKGKSGAYTLDFRDGKIEVLPFENTAFLRLVSDAK